MSQLDRLRANLPSTRDAALGRVLPPHLSQDPQPGRSGEQAPGDELIIAVLEGMGADYVIEDGIISGIWENGLFVFGALGGIRDQAGILQVRGVWERALRREQFPAALVFANEWNAQHVWPKVFVQAEDDIVMVHGEVTAELGIQPTSAQVDNLVNVGIVAALAAFYAAEAAFPDAQLISQPEIDHSD